MERGPRPPTTPRCRGPPAERGRGRRRRGAREAHPDVAPGEELLEEGPTNRVGTGFDVPAFAPGEALAGRRAIEHERGLKGHSDADVRSTRSRRLARRGRRGRHWRPFPPGDQQWKGAPSSRFVDIRRPDRGWATGRQYRPDADLRGAPNRPAPRGDARLGRGLVSSFCPTPVSVEATTTQRLGFTGRGEGMAAQAIATVRLPEENPVKSIAHRRRRSSPWPPPKTGAAPMPDGGEGRGPDHVRASAAAGREATKCRPLPPRRCLSANQRPSPFAASEPRKARAARPPPPPALVRRIAEDKFPKEAQREPPPRGLVRAASRPSQVLAGRPRPKESAEVNRLGRTALAVAAAHPGRRLSFSHR